MHPILKIFVLVVLLGGGIVLSAMCMAVLALAQGFDMNFFLDAILSGTAEFPRELLRGMLWIQALVGFILPACVFTLLFYRRTWKGYYGIVSTRLSVIIVALVALFAAYPLVQLAYEVNTTIPLPDWMGEMEDSAAEILKDILVMDNVGSFILTLILVAVLPGIGEELVFRGILQKQLEHWTLRPVLSVWIAAIIFSAIHMQFEGFLPRVALGAVLGFVYLWSGSLWVPIIVHAFNNGLQVAVLYFSGVDLSDVEQGPDMPMNPWIILLSVVVLYFCYELITKSRRRYG